MTSFTLTLPMPPTVNRLYMGQGRNKRLTPTHLSWRHEAGWRMNEARAKGAFQPLTADTWYWTDLRLPANHIGDSDNRLKAMHDLLHEMGATPDDQWLLGGTYMRDPAVLSGTCIVSATSMPESVESSAEAIQLIAERICAATFFTLNETARQGADTPRRA